MSQRCYDKEKDDEDDDFDFLDDLEDLIDPEFQDVMKEPSPEDPINKIEDEKMPDGPLKFLRDASMDSGDDSGQEGGSMDISEKTSQLDIEYARKAAQKIGFNIPGRKPLENLENRKEEEQDGHSSDANFRDIDEFDREQFENRRRDLLGPDAQKIERQIKKDLTFNDIQEKKRQEAARQTFQLGRLPNPNAGLEEDLKMRKKIGVRHKRIATAIEKSLREVIFVEQPYPMLVENEFTIIEIQVARKFRSARIYWQSYSDPELNEKVKKLLKRSSKQLRHRVQQKLNLKFAIDLLFRDASYSQRQDEMESLFESLRDDPAYEKYSSEFDQDPDDKSK